jgi:hypothetical protein
MNALKEMRENDLFSENEFEVCFKELDKDNCGIISRDMMKVFIMKMAGLYPASTPTVTKSQP